MSATLAGAKPTTDNARASLDLARSALARLDDYVTKSQAAKNASDAVTAAAATFRPNPRLDTGDAIMNLAVGEALESLGYQGVELKWPNDLYYQGRKLAGILVEMSGSAPA